MSEKPVSNEWFYQYHAQEVGPLSFQELQLRYASGGIADDGLVRRSGETTWQRADAVIQKISAQILENAASTTPKLSAANAEKNTRTENMQAGRQSSSIWQGLTAAKTWVYMDLRRQTLKLGLLLFLSAVGITVLHVMQMLLTPELEAAIAKGLTIEQFQKQNSTLQSASAMVALFTLPVIFGATIMNWLWILYAARNVRALGAVGMKISPGWAVAWNLIPIANLVMPYLAMREIAKASVNANAWQAQNAGQLIGIWWPINIVTGILVQMIFSASLDADTLPKLLALHELQLWQIPATWLLHGAIFLLYWQIYLAQAQQAESGNSPAD